MAKTLVEESRRMRLELMGGGGKDRREGIQRKKKMEGERVDIYIWERKYEFEREIKR